MRSLGVATLFVLVALGSGAPPANAAGAPVAGEGWSSAVQATSARLQAKVNPNGLSTGYHFDYIPAAAFEANVAGGKDGFSGGKRSPPTFDASIGSGSAPLTVLQLLGSLTPDTAYRYRVVATNSGGTTTGSPWSFVTYPTSSGASLPDSRGWEMVSPVDKNGGRVDPPGAIAGGGVLQAAAAGGAVTYGSETSFGLGGQGAPPASQYLAVRAAAGWATADVSASLYSGSYSTVDEGVPYRLFSPDLARGLLLNGRHCRGEGTGCPVANPPAPGSGAPAGYQNYYLRESATGSLAALLTAADLGDLDIGPAWFDVSYAGASPDLLHVVLSTCAALTADAVEVPAGEGCDAGKQNLYLWSAGAGIDLLNVLPAQSQGTPGAALAAQALAVSPGGGRVYWKDLAGGNLYLREGSTAKQVDAAAGGGGTFETASGDGAVAFYTKGGHLYRYEVVAGTSTDLTPGGGVAGVLGASADGSYLYYLDAAGIRLRHGATDTAVAAATDAVNYPPTTGSARVSADGTHLVFVSSADLTDFDNTDLNTGAADSQVYLYDTAAGIVCVSCNPSLGRPIGAATIPGAIANGTAPGSTRSYKPRALAADGRRVFFDSADSLALTDTNHAPDVYQWEAQGSGSCTRAGGCVSLLSGGREETGASFVDASADGSDAFFLTRGSLVGSDPGSVDLYDARVGGGFPEPPAPLPCQGDDCQVLPSEPDDPTLTTLLSGLGNPAVRYHRLNCREGFVKRGGKCVKKKGSGRKKGRGKGRRRGRGKR